MIAVASVAFAFHVESLLLGITARAVIGAGAAAIQGAAQSRLGALVLTGAAWPADRHPGDRRFAGDRWRCVDAIPVDRLDRAVRPVGNPKRFLWSAVPGIIMVFIVPLVIRDRPEELGLASLDERKQSTQGAADEPGFGYIMMHSGYPYLLALVYAGYLGSLYFVWTWFAAYLNAEYGINLRAAGLLWAFAATLPALLSQPVAGLLSDRIGRVRAVASALAVTTACAALFVVFAVLGKAVVPWWPVVALAVVFSFFVNMWVLVWPFTTIMFPTSAGGPIGGFMNTAAQLVGAAAPVVSGFFIDRTGSYVMIFVVGGVCALTGCIASLFLREHRVI